MEQNLNLNFSHLWLRIPHHPWELVLDAFFPAVWAISWSVGNMWQRWTRVYWNKETPPQPMCFWFDFLDAFGMRFLLPSPNIYSSQHASTSDV